MKILVIGSRIPFPLHDGGAIATYNMLKSLANVGLQVTYFSLNTQKHFVDESIIKKEFGFLTSVKTFKINTEISVYNAIKNLFSKSSYNIERFYSLEFENILNEEISIHSYDIIHFEGLFVAKYIEKIKANFKIPTLLRQHNIEFLIWQTLSQNETNLLKKWYLRLLAKRMEQFEKNIIPFFDKVVTIATTDEEKMKDWKGLKSIETIPGGFDLPVMDISNQPSEINHSVYHIGSMEWLPNQQAMEWFHHQIWPLVINKIPDAQFFMAGKNMPASYLQWESDNFHVSGEVPNALKYAEDKQILVVPLLSASGIRIKTIEAMMRGKAVITTSLGARGLELQSGIHCLIEDTANNFANAIILLLNHPDKRSELQKNGSELMCSKFEIGAVAEKWLKSYQSILTH